MTGLLDKSLHYLGKKKINAFVVNIGAMDGTTFEDMSAYVAMYRFPTLYVEPMPAMYDRLVQNPNIIKEISLFENAAIGETDGELEMLTIDVEAIDRGEIHPCFYGMSAVFPPRNGLASEGDRATVEKYGRKVMVPSVTLNTLFKKHNIQRIDVFKVDAEGFDYHVFKQLDLDTFRPKLIRMEWINLNEEEKSLTLQKLQDYNYEVEYMGSDIDAIASEFRQVVEREWDHLQEVAEPPAAEVPDPEEKPISVQEYSRKNNNVTIVTGLWDIGRNALQDGFRRPFDHYLMKFAELLKADVNMYIYVPKDLEDFVWSVRDPINTRIQILDNETMKTWFGFYDRVQQIRQSPSWREQASWLENSPQANLDLYNPIVMSKMFFLNDASIFNPFNTDYFFWIDGGITNTVHWGYFQKDKVFNNLPYYYDINNKFLFLSYPYEGNTEIHGFERTRMAEIAGTDYVRYVCRGGFFGGRKDHLNNINGLYYNYLQSSLQEGLMGTEESVFSILAHRHDDMVHRFEIGGDGMIWPFFEQLKDIKERVKTTVNGKKPFSEIKTSLYVLTFNSPDQFETLIESMLAYDANIIHKTDKYLVDNSTDLATTPRYLELCNKYGFNHIKKENLGICGGRQFVAEHFDQTDADQYIWSEDDMNFYPKTGEVCRMGFNRFVPNFYDKCLKIMAEENFDFLKICFTEFYGDNSTSFAWYNVPAVIRKSHWPEKPNLPVQGLDPNAPKTKFDKIKSLEGLPYVTGQIYYSNWTQFVSREGNKKMFLNTKWAHPFEATWMSYIFQETIKGEMNPGLLLITPIEHYRFDHYDAKIRKES